MSLEKAQTVTRTSTAEIKVTSTPSKAGSKPPAKSKRTISEVSEASAEEITIMNQQLEHLSSDLKDTRERVMNLMTKTEVQNFITETVNKVMTSMGNKIEKMIDSKIKDKTKELEDKISSLEFDKKNLIDRLTKVESTVETQTVRLTELEKVAIASAQRSNYNEQYSRKNNVKILNIEELTTETENTLTETITSTLLSKANIDLDPQDIIALHRIPGKSGATRPVLLKLKNNSVKTAIMKQRQAMKAAGYRLVDDVTKLNTGLIGRLMKHARIDSAWYFNGAVYGKTTEGRRHKFDIYCNINSVIQDNTAVDEEAGEMRPLILGRLEP